ncbi:MAG TPA: serine protease [Terriglobales bacterium]|nr:serine protease [Terriglobales bacterium]
MAEQPIQPVSEQVCETWQQFLQGILGIFLLLGTAALVHYFAPPPMGDLKKQVQQLSEQVQQLKQEQAMPAMVLNRYRDSICYIHGVYHVSFPDDRVGLRARLSGTGFVVANGLVATNRHVAEPWYGDPDAEALIRRGATPKLERLVAFFPGAPTPVNITPTVVSAKGDLAVLRLEDAGATEQLIALPLAEKAPRPGELVAVVGYPMGIAGMVAKSPTSVYERLAYRRDDIGAANELAALSLIRPSSTCGHLGDVVGDKLIYDAPTAHGGSGGPVFNARGEVIGVNSAYLDGFSGGTLGISAEALRPLIEAAQKASRPSDRSPAPTLAAKPE